MVTVWWWSRFRRDVDLWSLKPSGFDHEASHCVIQHAAEGFAPPVFFCLNLFLTGENGSWCWGFWTVHTYLHLYLDRYQIHTLLFCLEPTTIIVLDADWLHRSTWGAVTQLEPPSSGHHSWWLRWSYASGVILQLKHVRKEKNINGGWKEKLLLRGGKCVKETWMSGGSALSGCCEALLLSVLLRALLLWRRAEMWAEIMATPGKKAVT